jgi:L-threonylcarbamoyladenylate synthase
LSARVVPAAAAAVAEAAALLRAGALVAFPTETVYGLGCDATRDAAVAAVFAAKGRPRFNPLIVHVTGIDAAARVAVLDARARVLARQFWPGPLTLVLPRREDSGLSLLVSAGLDSVAVRAPGHPVAQALLAACDLPVAAPSANVSGAISPTRAADVVADLGERVALVLDGGACRIGIESTVVDLTAARPVLLRPGGVPEEALYPLLGQLDGPGGGPPRAPGLLARHYAPARPLRLNAPHPEPGEALLGFGGSAGATLDLSLAGDLQEAAANLFTMLRALDHRPDVAAIAVAPIPEDGLGVAINDRLRRAATPPGVADDWNDDRGPAAPCLLPGIDET